MYILYVIFIGEEKAGRMKTMNITSARVWVTSSLLFKSTNSFCLCFSLRVPAGKCFSSHSVPIYVYVFSPDVHQSVF